MIVQTPHFESFANDIGGITSRNELIYKLKRKCMERGFRSKLSMSTNNETKSLHVIFLCNKSGKSSLRCKNPSVRGLCPFLVLYERKSYCGVSKGHRHSDALCYTEDKRERYADGRRKGTKFELNEFGQLEKAKIQFKAIGSSYNGLFKSDPPEPSVREQLGDENVIENFKENDAETET